MRKSNLLKLTGAAFLIFAASSNLISCATNKVQSEKGPWKLVWQDEFNGNKLDLTKWDYQTGTGSQYGLNGWGNDELEYYTPENVSVKKGNLVIEARKENKNGMPYTSGRIRTMKDDGTVLYGTTFGRIEARMMLPEGSGIWPAFWMLPASTKYGVWASSGEIDIMEAKGRLPNRTYGTVHFGQPWPGNKYTGNMYKFPEDEDITDYHVYALEWEPGSLKWFVDDNLFYETSNWYAMDDSGEKVWDYPAPYDEPFYILFDLAIGGAYDEYRKPSDSDVPCQMLVDWVRVYQKDSYNMNVTRPIPERDDKAIESYAHEDGNYILDSGFETINKEGLKDAPAERFTSHMWYCLALRDFNGDADAFVENKECHVNIKNAGTENYSIQLVQNLGIAKGFTYVIEFDAKAETERSIAVKISGDEDSSWAVHSSEYHPSLDSDYKHFKYRFTMENDSDATARLEFNCGLSDADVWIKNVSIKTAEF
ncbi:MAG: glycoside hydrolase family 16 protein [Treponema sp.]|nr:glycoside hydrolase family 16 protein [Treponema sp.]